MMANNVGAMCNLGTQFNSFAVVAAPLSIADNIPLQPPRLVPRSSKVQELIRTLQTGERAGLVGVVAQGEGGQGKSTLALLYASADTSKALYTRGRVIARCSGKTPEQVFSSLAPSTLVGDFTLEARAKITTEILSRERGYLLILDNIDDRAHWERFQDSDLLPGNNCHLIVTCRENLPGLSEIPVDRLTRNECLDLLKQYRPSAVNTEYEIAIDTIVRETEQLAVLVAAVGAAMMSDGDDDWDRYADWLRDAPIEELPDVSSVEGYPHSAAAILDDLFHKLPDAERRAMEFAAFLPVDGIHPQWLEHMLVSDSVRAEAPLDMGKNSRGQPRDPQAVLGRLINLGVLSRASQTPDTDLSQDDDRSNAVLSFHRLHAKRIRNRFGSNLAALERISQAVLAVAESEERSALNSDLQVDSVGTLESFQRIVDLHLCLRHALEPAGQWTEKLQNYLVAAYVNRGNALLGLNYFASSIGDYNSAIAILDTSSGLEQPSQCSTEFQFNFAVAYMNRGIAQEALQDFSASLQDFGRAITIGHALKGRLEPVGQWVAKLQNDLAAAYMNRGNVRAVVLDLAGSLRDHDRAIEFRTALQSSLQPIGQWPAEFQIDLVVAYKNRGNARYALQDFCASIQDSDLSIALGERLRSELAARNQWSARLENELAGAYANRGTALAGLNDLSSAFGDYDKGITMAEELQSKLEPIGQWTFKLRSDLAANYTNRAHAHQAAKSFASSIRDSTSAIVIGEALRGELAPMELWSAKLQNDLAGAYMNRGNARTASQDFYAAILDYDKAIDIRDVLRNRLQEAGEWSATLQNDLALAYMNRGIVHEALQEISDSIRDYDSAIEMLGALRSRLEQHGQWPPRWRFALAAAYLNLGNAQAKLDKSTIAMRNYESAVEIAEALRMDLAPLDQWSAEFERFRQHAVRLKDSIQDEIQPTSE